jgi:hypothetical protein
VDVAGSVAGLVRVQGSEVGVAHEGDAEDDEDEHAMPSRDHAAAGQREQQAGEGHQEQDPAQENALVEHHVP